MLMWYASDKVLLICWCDGSHDSVTCMSRLNEVGILCLVCMARSIGSNEVIETVATCFQSKITC